MSLVASLLFSIVRGGAPLKHLLAIWVGTVIKILLWRFSGIFTMQLL